MTKEEITLFTENHYELTINERISLTINDGTVLSGFFKRHPESEAIATDKLKEKNHWEFFIISSKNNLPQEATIVDGDDISKLELLEI